MSVPRLLLSLLLLGNLNLHADDLEKLPKQKDRSFYALKGTVKTTTEQKWIPSKDSTIYISAPAITVDNSYTMERSEELAFGDNGDVQKQTVKESEGRKKNKMAEQVRTFFYDKNKLVAVSDFEGGKKTDSVQFHYRKKGQMDYYKYYNSKGDVQYTVDYVYKSGHVFSMRKKNEQQMPVATIKYKYKDDVLVETQHFDGQSHKLETRKYSLQTAEDGKVNDSYSVLDEKDNMKEGLLLVKDTLGRLLERNVIDGDRKVTEYNGYQYDTKGNPETEKIFNSLQELTIENRYTYDDAGNWTRKNIFHNGILTAVVTREIKYY
jgi:hypothetical protein